FIEGRRGAGSRAGKAGNGGNGAVAAAQRPAGDVAHQQVGGEFTLRSEDIGVAQRLLALDIVGEQGRGKRLLARSHRHDGGADRRLGAYDHQIGGHLERRHVGSAGALGMDGNEGNEQHERDGTAGENMRNRTYSNRLPGLPQCFVLTPERVRSYPASLLVGSDIADPRHFPAGTLSKDSGRWKPKFTTV